MGVEVTCPSPSGERCPEGVDEGASVAPAQVAPSPLAPPPGGDGSIANCIRIATIRLQNALALAPREARLEAQVLTSRALGVNRAWLVAHDRDRPTPDQGQAIEALITRRERGEPVAYILGEREFYGRPFRVCPDVLIPRPDTELLIDAALNFLPPDRPGRILDLGTGSGCIAITLALARPDCEVLAVDNAEAALEIAADNARLLRAHNVRFLLGNWCAPLGNTTFDLIVSNPPYIDESAPELANGDLPHEPRSALTPGGDGLSAIRQIMAEARPHLRLGGQLMFEHGYDQGPACRRLFIQSGYRAVGTLRDLANHERVSIGELD
ncbi:MAG: peptide chain release factor N(5)-glutamine methyltransferase [Pseudomonadota bacterium]